MTQLILASGSPRRKILLEQLGFNFTVHKTDISEELDPDLGPVENAERLAKKKVMANAFEHPDSVILAADTIVIFNQRVLGKPETPDQAKKMLKQLSGNSHTVVTAVSLVKTDTSGKPSDTVTFHAQTKVTFSPLTNKEIDAYVKSGSPMDKAGAYGIQDDLGSVFVSGIEGDYYNVVGLPLNKLYHQLKKLAPELLKELFYRDKKIS